MASLMVGRATCPECGFDAAHVKKSEKCLYRYCPECGAQHYAKTERQRQLLDAKTRNLEPPKQEASKMYLPRTGEANIVTITNEDATATDSTDTPKQARRGLFS